MTENTSARIEGAQKNVAKITKKLERVKAALDGGKNPYFYLESDFGRTERELAERWGIKINVRITEITETYQQSQNDVDVTFGESLPTLFEKLNKTR